MVNLLFTDQHDVDHCLIRGSHAYDASLHTSAVSASRCQIDAFASHRAYEVTQMFHFDMTCSAPMKP